MAASMRRFFATSPSFIRGYLACKHFQKPLDLGILPVKNTSRCTNGAKFLTVPARQLSTQDTDDGKTVKKPTEPSDAEIAAGVAYLQSKEYVERYGGRLVFANYRRNHKGRVPPMKTRITCVRGSGESRKVTGNPCPICRDENLVVHYKNVQLLEQFICPHSREVYSTARTGVCQKQYKKLHKAIADAKAHGLIPFPVPFVKYNYQDYYGKTKADMKTS